MSESETQNQIGELNGRQFEIIYLLYGFATENPQFEGYARPRDIGGSHASYHVTTLTQLLIRGIVERRVRREGTFAVGRSYVYRLTALGKRIAKRP